MTSDLDAAWEALKSALEDDDDGRVRPHIARHRPIIEAAIRQSPSIDVERLRVVFHDEYERDMTGDRYHGCRHANQHRVTWDCEQRAQEFAARLATPPEPGT